MAEVLRTWSCLNPRCGEVFDAWEANPPCPACGCLRVSWVPAGGHIGKVAGGVDSEFRSLADTFGLTDLVSAKRGEAAKVIAKQPQVDQRAQPAHTFAPGFSCVPHETDAVCVPSINRVDFRAQTKVGSMLPKSKIYPGVNTNTRIEATHRPKP